MIQINRNKVGNIIEELNVEQDLFHKGLNYKSYKFMGSHIAIENKIKGVRFTVWAPKAVEVYVVGEFSDFKPLEEYRMEKINQKGIWSLFISGIKEEIMYKYYIVGLNSKSFYKSDPYAFASELRPNTASIIKKNTNFRWADKRWINRREKIDILNSPINIYEIHLGSWKRKNKEFFTYEELCIELPKYLKEMNYTHVEFMPLIEHPLDASWGYQATGYYSMTSRYGDVNGLKKLINTLHKNNIGVIFDWVPGHFCKDSHGLYMFDGYPTYEYEEEWKANNKGWGTFNFDLGKPEVKSFLYSNAYFLFEEFHIDGLRVDAVSNMIYLDYCRKSGEWIPNKYGGNECLEGIEFLKGLNTFIVKEFNNILMIAEESTSWLNVCKPVSEGGLGFNLKWNMGWMNDTLSYVEVDPIYRKYEHNKITFSMMYNYSENFILPISHDEVVHGKKSLVGKMWGDYWNKFAGLRLYLAYMIGHPGKKLTFMGCEFAQFIEWREYEELEWKLIDEFDMHRKTLDFIKKLNKFYIDNSSLWELDYDPTGFEWIDADNCNQSIFSFIRKGKKEDEILVFVFNFTPVVYHGFRLGVPLNGQYVEVLNTDNECFGGSNQLNKNVIESEKIEYHNKPYSINIKIPPMAASIYKVNKIQQMI